MAVDVKRVQAAFLAAIEIPGAAERAALLDRECGPDTELRQRIEALLAAHDEPASMLDRPVLPVIEPGGADADGTVAFDGQTGNPGCSAPPTAANDNDPGTPDVEFLSPSSRPGSLGRLAHYEVLEVLGKGGFGVVVRAFDEKLQRVVAIKVMSAQLAATSPARKRFLREARAAAKVRHEHVVQIYDIQEQPIPYLVMEYIPGRTLQQKLDNDGPLEPQEMLRLALQITRGLAAAHAQDLIHRDIKPGNILLEEAIEPHVKITDFGLARAADDASLTQSGVVAGTPMYMAPEQAEGKSIDQRADLFSLGSVFYVMLSGRPPFRASGTMAVLKRVCEDNPRPIREIIPETPEWLCDVITRLHAKKPEERFQTAAEVVELLGKQQAITPSIPRQSPERERREGTPKLPGRSRSRFNRRSLVAAAGLLIAAVIGITYFVLRPRPDDVRPDGPAAVKGTDEFFDALKRENIDPSLLAIAGGGDPEQAPPELVAVLGDGRFCQTGLGWPTVSPDGKLLAVPWCANRPWDGPTSIVLFDAHTGALLRTFVGHAAGIPSAAFSPDGKKIVSAGHDGTIRVWDVATATEILRLKDTAGQNYGVAFSPDGKHITGFVGGSGKVWNADTGEVTCGLEGPVSHYGGVFTKDGTLIVGGSGNQVKVWHADTGRLARPPLEGHTSGVARVAFDLDGKLLATGSDAEVKLWDANTFKEIRTIPVSGGWLAFTPDGRTLLAGRHHPRGNQPQTVTRCDLVAKTETVFKLNDSLGNALYCVSPDGKTVFGYANSDSYVGAFNAETGKELFPRQGHEGQVHTVAISPDGRMVASGGADHTVRLWDLAKWQPGHANPPVRLLDEQHTGEVWSVAFSPDGKLLASGSLDRTIVLWEVASGKELRTLFGHSSANSNLAFSPDGQTIAAGLEDGSLKLWDVATGKPNDLPRRHSNWVRAVAFSPDGKLLASAATDETVQVCELATGRPIHKFHIPGAGWFLNVAFSPDGKKLAAGSNAPHNTLRVWDLDTKKVTTFVGHSNHVQGLHFHHEGHLVATAGHDGTVRYWDHAAGSSRVLTIGPGPFGTKVDQVAFSPKGGYLATANDNVTISILRVPTPPPAYAPGSPIKLPDPLELAKRSSPADALNRENIPPKLLEKAGGGDAATAPAELVAVLSLPRSPTPAHWIWFPDEGNPANNAPEGTRFFRKAFSVDVKVRPAASALLKIAADDEFTVWLNETKVGSGSAHRAFDFDVSKQLVEGTNLLAVQAHNKIGPAGLKVELSILPAAAPPTFVVSDDNWKSVQVALPGWQRPGFDDSLWAPAKSLGEVGDDPAWKSVRWNDDQAYSVAISPDGTLLASGHVAHVRLWDLATGQLRAPSLDADDSLSLAFSPNGKILAAAGLSGVITLWDVDKGQLVRKLQPPHGGWVSRVVFSSDGRTLASASADWKVRLWETATGKLLRTFMGHTGQVWGLDFSPDGKTLLSTGSFHPPPGEGKDRPEVKLWDVGSGWEVGSNDGHTRAVSFGLFRPDGQELATGGPTREIKLWDLRTGKVHGTLPTDVDHPLFLAWRPDGRILASRGPFQEKVHLWDLNHTPARAKTISLPAPPPGTRWDRGVAFTPEGRHLATANPDGTVYVLRLAERGVVFQPSAEANK